MSLLTELKKRKGRVAIKISRLTALWNCPLKMIATAVLLLAGGTTREK
jgi:hypothetical protein